MFAAYVFTIIDSQDMQERHRLGPVAVTPGSAQCKGRGLKIAHRFPCLSSVGHRGRLAPHVAMAAATSGATAKHCLWPGDVVVIRSVFRVPESSSGWVTPGGMA